MKNTDTENNSNKLTTVKTIYARVAILLLALNFCLTGYFVMRMTEYMDQRMEVAEQSQASQLESSPQRAANAEGGE